MTAYSVWNDCSCNICMCRRECKKREERNRLFDSIMSMCIAISSLLGLHRGETMTTTMATITNDTTPFGIRKTVDSCDWRTLVCVCVCLPARLCACVCVYKNESAPIHINFYYFHWGLSALLPHTPFTGFSKKPCQKWFLLFSLCAEKKLRALHWINYRRMRWHFNEFGVHGIFHTPQCIRRAAFFPFRHPHHPHSPCVVLFLAFRAIFPLLIDRFQPD